MKLKVEIIVSIVVLIMFITKFIPSQEIGSIDNLAYVTGIAIDTAKNNKIKVTLQFLQTIGSKEEGVSEEVPAIIDSAEGSNIAEAINLVNVYSSKHLNYSHCSIIVFSEEFAKKGISEEVKALINNNQIRCSTHILVSQCDAGEYIKQIKPTLEKLITKQYNTSKLETKYTGYVSYDTLGNFYNNFVSDNKGGTAILANIIPNTTDDENESSQMSQDGEKSESNSESQTQKEGKSTSSEAMSLLADNAETIEGKSSAENIGTAVLRDGKLIGKLNVQETIVHLLINNKVNSFVLNIPISNYDDKENEDFKDLSDKKVTMSFNRKSRTKITVDTSEKNPKIKIKVILEGNIVSIEMIDSSIEQYSIEKLENICNLYISDILKNYLTRVSKEFQCDIDNMEKYAKSNFMTIKDLKKYKWNEKIQNANFEIEVKTTMFSGINTLGNNKI